MTPRLRVLLFGGLCLAAAGGLRGGKYLAEEPGVVVVRYCPDQSTPVPHRKPPVIWRVPDAPFVRSYHDLGVLWHDETPAHQTLERHTSERLAGYRRRCAGLPLPWLGHPAWIRTSPTVREHLATCLLA